MSDMQEAGRLLMQGGCDEDFAGLILSDAGARGNLRDKLIGEAELEVKFETKFEKKISITTTFFMADKEINLRMEPADRSKLIQLLKNLTPKASFVKPRL